MRIKITDLCWVAQDLGWRNAFESHFPGCFLCFCLTVKRPLEFRNIIYRIVAFHDARFGSAESVSFHNKFIIGQCAAGCKERDCSRLPDGELLTDSISLCLQIL